MYSKNKKGTIYRGTQLRNRTFSEKIGRLKQEGLLRKIQDRNPNSTHPASRILIEGIEYINFASNDYLGLASNILVAESAKNAIDEYGFGAGASRLLSGGTVLHGELEKMVSGFKGTEAALIFNSGYAANTGAIPLIAGEGDIIFSDELNHASIIDGCRLSKARTIVYRHSDMGHLSELIKKETGDKKIVITDTVFSMDGDIAPLKEIHDICRSQDALLYLDDAHGTGVLGKGKGALVHFGLKPEPWIIQMGTFSKAFGSYGAFIAADSDVIELLINTSRGFIFSTTLPACVIAASMAALQLIQDETGLVDKLWQNRERLFKGLQGLGFNTLNSETPIIPVVVGDVEATLTFSERLKDHHIYAPAIRPPSVDTPRIRFAVTAAHTEEEIDKLIEVISKERV